MATPPPIINTVDLTNVQSRSLDPPQRGRVNSVYGLALDEKFVYATHCWFPEGQPKVSPEKGTLRVLSKGDLSEVRRITVGHFPRRVALDPDRRRAYVNNYHQDSYSLSIVDLAAGMEIHEVKLGAAPIDVAVDTVRNRVFVTVPLAQSVYVIDPDPFLSGQFIVQKVNVGLSPNGITVDERDGRVYVICGHGLEGIGVLTVLQVTDAGYAIEHNEPVLPDFCRPEFVTVDPLSECVYVGCIGGGGVQPQVAVFERTYNGAHPIARLDNFDARWGVRGLDVDQSLNLLYAAEEAVVEAFEIAGRNLAGRVTVGKHMNGLVVDKASSQIYVADDLAGSVVRITPKPVLTVEPRAPAGAVLAAAANNDRWSVFVVSEDRTVQASHWRESGWLQADNTEPDWSPWQQLTGATFPPGAPLSALSRRPGGWDLAGIDDNGRLRVVSGVDDAPDGWRDLGGSLPPGGHLSMLSLGSGSVGVFTVAGNGRVWSTEWNDQDGSTSERDHGGDFPPGAPIVAVSRKAGQRDLFAVHADGTVYTQWWSTESGQLSEWTSIGGPFAPGTRIAAGGRVQEHLDVFGVGTNGAVWTAWWTLDTGWSEWQSLGGNFPPGCAVAAISKTFDGIDLFVTGPEQQVYTAFWHTVFGWSTWEPVGGLVSRPGAPLAVADVNIDPGIESMPNILNVVWTAPNGAVETGWWSLIQDGWSPQLGVRRRISTPRVHWNEPTGNADDNLNGSIHLSLWSDGSYAMRGHIHNSGFDPHRFIAQAALALPSGEMAFSTYHRGRADGSGSEPFPWDPKPDRDHDWMEIGSQFEVEQNFSSTALPGLVDASLLKSFVNKNIGLGGGIHSLLSEVLGGFLIGALSLNPATGTFFAAVGLGSEMLDLIGADLEDVVPPGGLAGLVTAGGIIFALGPGAMIPAVVAGAVVGAQVQHRTMSQNEADFAKQVFGETLPPREDIIITNLHSFGGKPFVFPHGGKTLLNMGDFWEEDEPITATWPEENFTEPGQLFIHELTHVWQVAHESASFGGWVTCGGLPQIFGAKNLVPHTDDWDGLNVEQKAIIVDQWYRRHHASGLAHPDALNDDYFHFIRDIIRNPPGGTS